MLLTIVGQGYERFSREQASVETDPGYPPADSFRVLAGNLVEGVTMTVGDLEALPRSGNARIDAEGGTSLLE